MYMYMHTYDLGSVTTEYKENEYVKFLRNKISFREDDIGIISDYSPTTRPYCFIKIDNISMQVGKLYIQPYETKNIQEILNIFMNMKYNLPTDLIDIIMDMLIHS